MGRQDANLYRDLQRTYPSIQSAAGVRLRDSNGKQYLDFGAGIAVTNIGYGVKEVLEAMQAQLAKTTYVYGGYFTNEPRIELSQKLLALSPEGMSRVIVACSGSEANEVAIKMARQYHCETGNSSKHRVISRRQSYHGNTLGSLSASGRPAWRSLFLPYMYDFPQISPPYCYRCAFAIEYPECRLRCAQELEEAIITAGKDTVSAFIAEPIIGTTVPGATPPAEYYPLIRSICDKYDVLFIADEVIMGLGRTGKNFGIDHWNVVPDIVTVAKGLGAGYCPVSAVILHERIHTALANGSQKHTQGFTYTGNPLSCAAGAAVLRYVEKHNLVEQARKRGEYLEDRLEALRDISIVGDVRGKGLFQGIEFVRDRADKTPFPVEAGLVKRIVGQALQMGLVLIEGMPGCVDGVRGDQIQISPAFVIDESDIDCAVDVMRQAIAIARDELSQEGFSSA